MPLLVTETCQTTAPESLCNIRWTPDPLERHRRDHASLAEQNEPITIDVRGLVELEERAADEAFITLATTDAYCMGARVVAGSLRKHGTSRRIVVMVTPNVSVETRFTLEGVFDEVIVVDLMDSEDRLRLSWLRRPELGVTFTKIHCWTLTQFSKCVFLDADTLVLCNVDELFEREELSAAPDPGWPDCFNSGVFVFKPSLQTHSRILDHALQHGSFDGGDQGLLNSFFSSWPVEDISKHLPFIYNLSANAIYTYLPAFQRFGKNAKIVHFLGADKPWSSSSPGGDSHASSMEGFRSLWWKEFNQSSMSLHAMQQDQHSVGTEVRSSSSDLQGDQMGKPEAPVSSTERLDASNSLLAHFSPPSKKLDSPAGLEPSSHSDKVPLKDNWKPPDKMEMEDSQEPLGAEGLEAADTYFQRPDEEPIEVSEHRREWEEGHVDYMGRDAFHNIQKMLDRFLDQSSS